jgi:hypothetical protein
MLRGRFLQWRARGKVLGIDAHQIQYFMGLSSQSCKSFLNRSSEFGEIFKVTIMGCSGLYFWLLTDFKEVCEVELIK